MHDHRAKICVALATVARLFYVLFSTKDRRCVRIEGGALLAPAACCCRALVLDVTVQYSRLSGLRRVSTNSSTVFCFLLSVSNSEPPFKEDQT